MVLEKDRSPSKTRRRVGAQGQTKPGNNKFRGEGANLKLDLKAFGNNNSGASSMEIVEDVAVNLHEIEDLFNFASISQVIEQNYCSERKKSPINASNKENADNTSKAGSSSTSDSEQTTPSTPVKKRRRRSFLDSPALLPLKSLKSKKRRESLLSDNTNGSVSNSTSSNSLDSDVSDGSDTEGEITPRDDKETQPTESFYSLEEIMDFILFSNNSEKFVQPFLLTYASVISSSEIVEYLQRRWSGKHNAKQISIIQKQIVTFLSKWIEASDETTYDTKAIRLIDNFIDILTLQISSNNNAPLVESIQALINQWRNRHLINLQISSSSSPNILCSPRHNTNVTTSHNAAIPLSLETNHQIANHLMSQIMMNVSTSSSESLPSTMVNLNLHRKYTALEFASQMTVLEHSLYKRIQIKELLNTNWMKSEKEKNALSPNLLKMIAQSTATTLWIVTNILSETDVKERAKIIKFFVLVAQKCKELNNFNGVMTIIGALSHCSISRLKKTWAEVKSKTVKLFEGLCDIMLKENYKEYRFLLSHISNPCVPFPGMWLTDLFFIDQASESSMMESQKKNQNEQKKLKGAKDHQLLNINKMIKTAKIFTDILRFQQMNYLLPENRDLQHLLRHYAYFDDDDKIYELSCYLEAPSNSNLNLNNANNSNNNNNNNNVGNHNHHNSSPILNSNYTIDYERVAKLETQARNISDYEELLFFIEKCNRKCNTPTNSATDNTTSNKSGSGSGSSNGNGGSNVSSTSSSTLSMNNTFIDIICASEVIEILLEYLITHPITANLVNSIKLLDLQKQVCYQLQILFSYCLVGDDAKRQQLLQCLNIIWSLYLRSQDLHGNLFSLYFKELIHCFKIPLHYRQIAEEINVDQREIDRLTDKLNSLMNAQFIQEDDEKETMLQKKMIKINKKILNLQQKKKEKIDLKVEKKIKIQQNFQEIQQKYQIEFTKISDILNKNGNLECEKTDIIHKLTKNEEVYRTEKTSFNEHQDTLSKEEEELLQEKRKLLERIQKIDTQLNKISAQKAENEGAFKHSQKKFHENKKQLKMKADNLIYLLQAKEQQTKDLTQISHILGDFAKFFNSALGMSSSSNRTHSQLEEDENYMIYREKYLKSIYVYLSIKETNLLHIKDSLKRNVDTISAINKMQLSHDVLITEFPHYSDLQEKVKSLKKDLLRHHKDFTNFCIEKVKIGEDQILENAASENAKKCRNLYSIVKSLFDELLAL